MVKKCKKSRQVWHRLNETAPHGRRGLCTLSSAQPLVVKGFYFIPYYITLFTIYFCLTYRSMYVMMSVTVIWWYIADWSGNCELGPAYVSCTLPATSTLSLPDSSSSAVLSAAAAARPSGGRQRLVAWQAHRSDSLRELMLIFPQSTAINY